MTGRPSSQELAAATRRVFDLLMRRYGAANSETTWGQAETLAAAALGDAAVRLRAAEQALEDMRERAGREPLGVDISDYGDEWVAGFLHGQENALDALVRRALEGAAE